MKRQSRTFNHTLGALTLSLSTLVAVVLAAGSQSPAKPPVDLPDTPAGACAAAYLEAFNSGDEDQMRGFLQRYRSESYLKQNPIDEQIQRYLMLREVVQVLLPLRVVQSTKQEIILLARASATNDLAQFRFEVEGDPPHRLVVFQFRRADPSELATGSHPLSEQDLNEAIEAAARVLDATYVDPKLGKKMADTLRLNQSKGRYRGITSPSELAGKLTDDLYAICRDGHLAIRPRAATPEEAASDPAEDPDKEVRNNYGLRKVELLPGNIGYVNLTGFHHSKEAQKIAAAALAFVANCQALIFDLRQNGGGSPEMIQFLCSYLFDKPTHLNSFYNRVADETSETWTFREIPGKRFDADLPVYVLTSAFTFSAAEEFAYDLKHLKRATIVGKTTGGGAHPVTERNMGDRFQMRVPYARAVNPITKTNWEGVGVIPDINVPASQALKAACDDATKRVRTRQES